jgi:hypothetical protein
VWIHRVRTSFVLVIALAAVGLLPACGRDKATDSITTTAAAAPPTTPTSGGQSFVSDLYGYSVDSWSGLSAKKAWDGTGSPGNGDPRVDTLTGPESQLAFGYAAPTEATLKRFVARFRVTDSKVHPCPVEPETSRRTTISGEPAIVHEKYCPAAGGPFVLQAFTKHAGQMHVFFTYAAAGNEPAMREWFDSLLQSVSFDS